MKLKQLVVAVSLSLGLVACGGGGSSSSSSSDSSYDFKVTAVDGYLNNAIVTATCGTQTFTGVTDENGEVQLDTNGIDSKDCSVVITANPDGSTTDMDTGETYAAGELYLVSPAGQDKTDLIASPFTTLVALLMESSGDLDAAIAEVALQFGIAPSLVTGDFIAAQAADTELKEEAQKAALKATALLASLPKTADEFAADVADTSTTQTLIAKLLKINDAVEAEIAELENSGTDLSSVIITVEVAADGSVTTVVEDKPQATGSAGSSVGGGTGS